MPIAATPVYEIKPNGDGTWGIWLRGKLVAQFPTQQQAIDAAKVRAVAEEAEVEWDDPKAGKQGPVKPSRFGWLSRVR